MIFPPFPCFIIILQQGLIMFKVPIRFVLIMFIISSSLTFIIKPSFEIPALLTSISNLEGNCVLIEVHNLFTSSIFDMSHAKTIIFCDFSLLKIDCLT